MDQSVAVQFVCAQNIENDRRCIHTDEIQYPSNTRLNTIMIYISKLDMLLFHTITFIYDGV